MNNFENNPNHKNVNDIHIQMDRTKNDKHEQDTHLVIVRSPEIHYGGGWRVTGWITVLAVLMKKALGLMHSKDSFKLQRLNEGKDRCMGIYTLLSRMYDDIICDNVGHVHHRQSRTP